MLAKLAFSTGTVNDAADNVVMDKAPMLADWMLAEKTFMRSLTCKSPEMLAFALR